MPGTTQPAQHCRRHPRLHCTLFTRHPLDLSILWRCTHRAGREETQPYWPDHKVVLGPALGDNPISQISEQPSPCEIPLGWFIWFETDLILKPKLTWNSLCSPSAHFQTEVEERASGQLLRFSGLQVQRYYLSLGFINSAASPHLTLLGQRTGAWGSGAV